MLITISLTSAVIYHWDALAYSLVLSVAVVSMKMFVVLPGTILESVCQLTMLVRGDIGSRCELMMGGIDRTWSLES
jgi:hypothetical protein